MSIRSRLVRLAAALAVALCALTAAAQDTPPPAEPPAEPALEVIEIGSVVSRAIALEERVKSVEADLAEATIQNRAQADLDEVAAAIEEARPDLDATLERSSLASELQTLSTRWDGYAERLTDIQQTLRERLGKLDADLTAMQDAGELWKRTEAKARETAAPQAVRSRISSTRKLLRSTEASITKGRNAALELQSRAAQLLESISPVKQRIAESSDAMAAGLLVRQDEPLWRAWPGWEPLADDVRALLDVIAQRIDAIESYTQRKRGVLVTHVLAILGLAWLFLRTRRFVAAQQAATGVDPGGALKHPASAAILAGYLLTPTLQPEIVQGLLLLGAVATLPFWYRVLSGMLPAALQSTLRGSALLVLVEIIRLGFFAQDFVGRSVLLAELLAGAAGVLWLRRPARLAVIPSRLRDSGWMRLLDGWLRLVLFLFVVGAVCAVVGYTSFAGRLCMLAISGSFYGAGLLAMVRILELVSEHFLSASFFDGIHMIRDRRGAVVSGLSTVFRVGGFGFWAHRELGRAQLWEPLSGAATAALAQPLGFGTTHFTLGGILAFFLTLWLSWMVARFVGSLLNDEVFPRLRMAQGVPFALSRFAHYGVLVIGFVIAMGTLGFSLDRVTLLLSALGVGIGFGLQTVVNNFVSGVILLFERPVRVGDRVQLADLLGEVTHIGIRASRIRTFDGSDVIVPNGDLVASQLINWTLSDAKRRIILPVGVAYGTDPAKVLEVLGGVAREHPEVLDDPGPEILMRNFGDSSLEFELRAWTESTRGWNSVRSDLAVSITGALAEAGIKIPFPQRDLHLRNLDQVREALGRG